MVQMLNRTQDKNIYKHIYITEMYVIYCNGDLCP